MGRVSECKITVEWNGRSYSGLYSHVEDVLIVTAFGSGLEKHQRSVLHYGNPDDRARLLFIAMVESGKVDAEL